MEMELLPIIKALGLPVALVIYLLWRDHKRAMEDRQDKLELTDRVRKIEDDQKGELLHIATRTTEALTRVSESQEQLAASTDRLHVALLSRRCLATEDQSRGGPAVATAMTEKGESRC